MNTIAPLTARYIAEITVKFRLPVASTSLEAAHAEARRQAIGRQGIQAGSVDNVWVTPLTREDLRKAENLRAWQESTALLAKGTMSQRDRWGAGCLPDEELLDIARGELFRGFTLFTRRSKMGFSAIEHPRPMSPGRNPCLPMDGRKPDDVIDWRTTPNPPLSEREHRTLQAMNDAANDLRQHPWLRQESPAVVASGISLPELVGVAPREHTGECRACKRSTYERSALVTVTWAGRTLSREYVL